MILPYGFRQKNLALQDSSPNSKAKTGLEIVFMGEQVARLTLRIDDLAHLN